MTRTPRSCLTPAPILMAAALGGRLDRWDRQVDLGAGEQRAERDTRCQAHAAEQHDDHDLPKHELKVLRSSARRYGSFLAWVERDLSTADVPNGPSLAGGAPIDAGEARTGSLSAQDVRESSPCLGRTPQPCGPH
jgi:hypothetical protein